MIIKERKEVFNIIFRGYVEVADDKTTKDKRKGVADSDLRSYEEVQSLNGYAGVIRNRITLVDFDNPEDGKLAIEMADSLELNYIAVKTTRGYHLYFRSVDEHSHTSSTNKYTPVGLVADYKHGLKDDIGILKLAKHERDIVRYPKSTTLSYLPVIFKDSGYIYDSRIAEDLQEGKHENIPMVAKIKYLEEGERNSTLYSYLLSLTQMGLSTDECKHVISVINNHLLDNPLSEDEIESVTRDEAFKKEVFFIKGKFQADKFVNYMIKEYHIKLLDGEIYYYNDGIYITNDNALKYIMGREIPNFNDTNRNTTLNLIRHQLEFEALNERERLREADSRFICFANGLYDLESKQLRPHTPDIVVTNKIPHNYNPVAYNETYDKVLDDLACHDKVVRTLLEEIIASMLYRDTKFQTAFILIGPQANGKSTFLDSLSYMIGSSNTSNLDLRDIGDRFRGAEIVGKLANIGDDISDEYIKDTAILKKAISGEPITFERKGKDPFSYRPRAKMIFSANNLPRINDKTGAMMRRLILVPFNADFSQGSGNRNADIKHYVKTDDVAEYMIRLAIDKLPELITNGWYTVPEQSKSLADSYEKSNNPFKEWFDSEGKDQVERNTTSKLFSKFKMFCSNGNYSQVSEGTFREYMRGVGYETTQVYVNLELCEKLNVKHGRRVRIYKPIS